MKALKSPAVIAASGVLITAALALVAMLNDWSAELVALVGGITAAALGLWRALAKVASRAKKAAPLAILAACMALSCTAAQRKAVAVTALAASADAAKCALACDTAQCRLACASSYGAAMAQDLIAHMLLAAQTGAHSLEIELPDLTTPPAPVSGAAPAE